MNNEILQNVPIGDRIRWAIEVRGYKQTEVAQKIGITQAAVSNWITGASRKPNALTLLRLCQAINVNPYWICFGEGDPFKWGQQ